MNDRGMKLMDQKGLEKRSLIYSKALEFSVRAVNCYKYLCNEKKEYVMSKQFLKSSTSIGANVAEANGAVSRADFRNKLAIAYKECLETKYWLDLLKRTDF
jgi:four helix bundle protein